MNNLDKQLDTVFSKYIRLKYTDEDGNGNCFTCDDRYQFHFLQCGHFIKRAITLYRHDKNNARIQCKDCNEFKAGNMEVYEDRLIDEIGIVKVAEMKFKTTQDFAGFTNFEKRQMLFNLRKQCRELLKDKNFNITIP